MYYSWQDRDTVDERTKILAKPFVGKAIENKSSQSRNFLEFVRLIFKVDLAQFQLCC
jgi:hypothetical protein